MNFVFVITFAANVFITQSIDIRNKNVGELRANKNLEFCLASSIPLSQISSPEWNEQKYNESRFSQNNRISRYPIIIVSVNTTEHISSSLKCARLHNITQVIPRSGGHSYEAYSTCNGCFVIDLRYMDHLHVDSSTKLITAEPGILLGHMNYRLWTDYNIVIPSGSCPYVGLGGYVLGGGYGFLSRKYGLLADSVIEFKMVDYKGDIIIANETSNKDLFWANRGGGGGQFGIVTEVKIQGYDLGVEEVIHFAIYYDINYFKEAVFWLEKNALTAPRELGFELVVAAYDQLVELKGYYVGHEAELEHWMRSSQIRKCAPILKETRSYFDYITYLLHAGFLPYNTAILKERFPVSPKSPFKHVSAISKRPVSIKMLSEIEQKLQELPWEYIEKVGSGVFLIFAPYGGKISDLNDTDTAFPHRKGVRFMMQLGFYWAEGFQTKNNIDSVLKWQREAKDIVMKDLEGAFLNYADSGLKHHLTDYYGVNVPRLKKVKSAYDPQNLFNFDQSIPVS
jgi:FAD/FMN-containing dehydrogenase